MYYTFRKSNGDCVNRVSRFTLSGNTVDPASEKPLITGMATPSTNHNGGDLQFGKDRLLYISVGDGGCDYKGDSGCGGFNDAARDQNVLFGKILRINRWGGIPSSNPFRGSDSGRCNLTGQTSAKKCQETFAWGLRNPFRMTFDPNVTGTRFFINDVGQNMWEEIDQGIKGADYGWDRCEGRFFTGTKTRCDSASQSMTDPIHNYSHGSGCSSITGGAFVPNGIWPAEYDNAYLFADYVCGKIFKLKRNTTGWVQTEFAIGLGGSSAVTMIFGPHKETQALYYTTFERSGQVRRIYHASADENLPPHAAARATPQFGELPLKVRFDATDSSDPENDVLQVRVGFRKRRHGGLHEREPDARLRYRRHLYCQAHGDRCPRQQ